MTNIEQVGLETVSEEPLPCPFCGNHLVRSEFRSTRSVERREHPADVDCILSGIIISMEDRDDDVERRAAWNRRSPVIASRLAKQEPAWGDVIAERQRQVGVEGWTPEHDDQHQSGELARAAASYAFAAAVSEGRRNYFIGNPDARDLHWPWEIVWWKPTNRRRDLIKAGALILAEIERLDRLATSPVGGSVS